MSTDENTALYSADGRAFGAVHAAPALTADSEVGRVTRALQVDDLLALAARIKGATEVSGGDADQLAEGCEMAVVALRNLAADLEQEREANRLTVMRWQASREASEALGTELAAAREEAGITLQAAQAEISDLKARLLEMTACAADAARDTQAALTREGVALARLRKADGVQTALEGLSETVTGRPYPEVSADLAAQIAADRIYMPTDDGSCMRCGRPEADHAGSDLGFICPSVELAEFLTKAEGDGDPDASERVTPDEIAAALKAHREQEHLAGAPFVALGDLVADLLAVTRDIEEIERVPWVARSADDSRKLLLLLKRQDTIDRALGRAVAK